MVGDTSPGLIAPSTPSDPPIDLRASGFIEANGTSFLGFKGTLMANMKAKAVRGSSVSAVDSTSGRQRIPDHVTMPQRCVCMEWDMYGMEYVWNGICMEWNSIIDVPL